MDEALSIAREKLEAQSEDLVEKIIETTHVKQTQLTTKDHCTKGVLPLIRQPAKHPASGCVDATEDMS